MLCPERTACHGAAIEPKQSVEFVDPPLFAGEEISFVRHFLDHAEQKGVWAVSFPSRLQVRAVMGIGSEVVAMDMPSRGDIGGRANVKLAGSDMLDRIYALDFHIGMIS